MSGQDDMSSNSSPDRTKKRPEYPSKHNRGGPIKRKMSYARAWKNLYADEEESASASSSEEESAVDEEMDDQVENALSQGTLTEFSHAAPYSCVMYQYVPNCFKKTHEFPPFGGVCMYMTLAQVATHIDSWRTMMR